MQNTFMSAFISRKIFLSTTLSCHNRVAQIFYISFTMKICNCFCWIQFTIMLKVTPLCFIIFCYTYSSRGPYC